MVCSVLEPSVGSMLGGSESVLYGEGLLPEMQVKFGRTRPRLLMWRAISSSLGCLPQTSWDR